MKKVISIFFISLSLLFNNTLFSHSLSLPAPTIYSQHCDTLFWSKVLTANYYKLQIAMDIYFQNVILDSNHIPDTMFVLSNGFGNLQAYYHVRAFNSTDTSAWSLTQTLLSFLPNPPIFLGYNDSTIFWGKISGVTSYRLQISTDSTFGTIILDQSNITDTFYRFASPPNTTYWIKLRAFNTCGSGMWSPIYHFTVYTYGIRKISNKIPERFTLYQNYPNPFNPSTKIKFDIPQTPLPAFRKGGIIILKIYDLLGREVITLFNKELQPGTYEVEWNGMNFSSGMYFYKPSGTGGAWDFTETKKLVLMK